MLEKREKSRSSFSIPLLFASFFATAMIGIAFAYFNFKFSQYKFINFKDWILYEKINLFKPSKSNYTLLIYNSKVKMPKDILNLSRQKYHLLAIDFAQRKFRNRENITFLTAPTNTLLKIIQRFNIYKVPSILILKESKKELYKQDSAITVLN